MAEAHHKIMSYVSTKGKFHVALNGVGLLIQGAPDKLGYQQGQVPIYGNRFASGDRSYNDLSQWWYFVQTDWSGGFKDSQSWSDDAKFYYSTNIDTWSEIGAIKLTRKQFPSGSSGDNDFTYDISCGFEGEVGGGTEKYIATFDEADSRPHLYQAATGEDKAWTDISTTTLDTTRSVISQVSTRLGFLWASTIGTAATWVVFTWISSTFTDNSAWIATLTSFTPNSSRCHCEFSGIQYVFVEDAGNDSYAMVKTSVKNPSGAVDWSLGFEATLTSGLPVACAPYNGMIYYLIKYSNYAELWSYDISSEVTTRVRKFNGASLSTSGVGDKLLVDLNGKLIITIPNQEIWELNGTSLTQIFSKDDFKDNFGVSAEIDAGLFFGCVIQDNKAWWGNLMYDGVNFFNTWKADSDSSTNTTTPLFADGDKRIWESGNGVASVLWSVNLGGSLYKGTADKNFVVLNNFDTVSGVEKLAYTATILFNSLVSGQKIIVEYLTGEISNSASWTSLGSADFAVDGGSVTNKKLFFPVGTVFNKLWIRIKLQGGGSNTPVMQDFVMEYLPVPTYQKLWTLNLDAADNLRSLDGSLVETTGRELRALLQNAWWTKSTLDFQDLDYATTVLDGNISSSDTTITVPNKGTRDFPEQGRFRIGDEEILYTGKTPTTFTGCTRGARGTRAIAHSDEAVLNNAYKVIITDLQTRVPVALKGKELEYIVGVSLRET